MQQHEATERAVGGGKKARTFEDLWVWQEARKLVRDVYSDLQKGQSAGEILVFGGRSRRR